jgi:hypothetical protein
LHKVSTQWKKEMPGLNVGLRSSCPAVSFIGANLILGISIRLHGISFPTKVLRA